MLETHLSDKEETGFVNIVQNNIEITYKSWQNTCVCIQTLTTVTMFFVVTVYMLAIFNQIQTSKVTYSFKIQPTPKQLRLVLSMRIGVMKDGRLSMVSSPICLTLEERDSRGSEQTQAPTFLSTKQRFLQNLTVVVGLCFHKTISLSKHYNVSRIQCNIFIFIFVTNINVLISMIIEKKNPLNCFDEMQYVEHWCKDIFQQIYIHRGNILVFCRLR